MRPCEEGSSCGHAWRDSCLSSSAKDNNGGVFQNFHLGYYAGRKPLELVPFVLYGYCGPLPGMRSDRTIFNEFLDRRGAYLAIDGFMSAFGLSLGLISPTTRTRSNGKADISMEQETGLPEWMDWEEGASEGSDGAAHGGVDGWFTGPSGDLPHIERIDRTTPISEIVRILAATGCLDLTGRVQLDSTVPVTGGGFADIYRARLDDGSDVAIKLAMNNIDPHKDPTQTVAHEAHVWSKCHHQNILTFLGFAFLRGQIAIISPWMANGTLPNYLEQYPDSDRVQLCTQVASGVEYLHSNGIVHGDLKGSNVLVSEFGTAMLTDFGNAHMMEYDDIQFDLPSDSDRGMTLRWAPPERLNQEGGTSQAGDVYSLGMTVLEVITGQIPYSHLREMLVLSAVLVRNEIPRRPATIPGNVHGNILWLLLISCWDSHPTKRPPAGVVRDRLSSITQEELWRPADTSSETERILWHLAIGGCPDLTSTLDQAQCVRLPVSPDELSTYRGVLYDGSRVSLRPLEPVVGPSRPPSNRSFRSAAEELRSWFTCEHRNVLQLLGVAALGDQIVLVYPWLTATPLLPYLFNHHETNRCLMGLEFAQAMVHLHDRNLWGLDKGSVMVSEGGLITYVACGNAKLDVHQMRLLYTAPGTNNIIKPPSKEDAVYALGMILFELTSNNGLLGATHCLSNSMIEQIPIRPLLYIQKNSSCGDRFWSMLLQCWSLDVQDRPEALEVVEIMESINDEGLYGHPNGVRPLFAHSTMSTIDLVQSITGHFCPLLAISTIEQSSIDGGKQSEIYRGTLADDTCVAIATRRCQVPVGDLKAAKEVAREVYTWLKCDHDNVLKLFGVAEIEGKVALITPWIGGRSMPMYLETAGEGVNRCRMSTQISEGVAYLHSIGMVHGDIKGANVLVLKTETQAEIIKLCDFGTAYLCTPSIQFQADSNIGGTYRWMSPESVYPEDYNAHILYTEASDVWSLGMTILECFTGQIPFLEHKNPKAIFAALDKRTHPTRPTRIIPPGSSQGDILWDLLTKCWSYIALERPSAAEVSKIMGTISQNGLVVPG